MAGVLEDRLPGEERRVAAGERSVARGEVLPTRLADRVLALPILDR